MRIPQGVVGCVVAGLARPLNVDQTNSRFDQSPSQKYALSPAISAVSIANGVWFFGNVECLSGLPRGQQIECLLLERIVGFERTVEVSRTVFEL
jgi:hypothetical protein